VIAQAAMREGLFARTAETIGMAQRGGSVLSHVRYGQTVFSPLIPQGRADVILGFEPGETVRAFPYLKENGLVIAATKAIWPAAGGDYDVDAVLGYLSAYPRMIAVDAQAVSKACGTSRTLNIAMIGAAVCTGALGISLESVRETLIERLPARILDMNLEALRVGAELINKGGMC
jgi:indolepyruvate ferredoxin oxidoreductase beta subunit